MLLALGAINIFIQPISPAFPGSCVNNVLRVVLMGMRDRLLCYYNFFFLRWDAIGSAKLFQKIIGIAWRKGEWTMLDILYRCGGRRVVPSSRRRPSRYSFGNTLWLLERFFLREFKRIVEAYRWYLRQPLKDKRFLNFSPGLWTVYIYIQSPFGTHFTDGFNVLFWHSPKYTHRVMLYVLWIKLLIQTKLQFVCANFI